MDSSNLTEFDRVGSSYEHLLSDEEFFNSLATTDPPWKLNILKMPPVRVAIIVVYVIIITVGVVTNSAVIVVGIKPRRSLKHHNPVTTIFVIVLATSDFCLCIFSLPVQLHYQLTEQWTLGHTMCRIVFSAFALPMYVSAFTILLIAVDRYRLVIYPLKNRLSPQLAFVLIFINVAFSVVMSSPVVYYSTIEIVDLPDIRIFKILCVEKWSNVQGRRVYSVLTFCFQFCLPLALTTFLYAKIYSRLKCRNKLRSKGRKGNNQKHNSEQFGTKSLKTFKILLAIVLNFAVCWTPWNVFSLVSEVKRDVVGGPFFFLVDILLKAFAMLSACTNPVLYCWLNDQLRQDIQVVVVKLKLSANKNESFTQSKDYSKRKLQNLPRLTVEPPSCGLSRNFCIEQTGLNDRLSDERSTSCLTGKLISSSSN